jgi:hypothetical protein
MTEPTRDFLVCAAALLDQGRAIDRLSRPLTAAALIGILVYPIINGLASPVVIGFAALIAFAGLVEAYFAARVGFDAALFHRLAGAPEAPDFGRIDAALTRLGLLAAATPGRPVDARVDGAKWLFKVQILALMAQLLSVLTGASVALMWR